MEIFDRNERKLLVAFGAICVLLSILTIGVLISGLETCIDKDNGGDISLETSMGTNDTIDMLDIINVMRIKGGMCGDEYMKPTHPLKLSNYLVESSYYKSRDLPNNKVFGHEGSGTDTDFVENEPLHFKNLIDYFSPPKENYGENIALGQESVEDVVKAWKRSPGHCKNMYSGDFNYMGASVFVDKHGIPYWTQHFTN